MQTAGVDPDFTKDHPKLKAWIHRVREDTNPHFDEFHKMVYKIGKISDPGKLWRALNLLRKLSLPFKLVCLIWLPVYVTSLTENFLIQRKMSSISKKDETEDKTGYPCGMNIVIVFICWLFVSNGKQFLYLV